MESHALEMELYSRFRKDRQLLDGLLLAAFDGFWIWDLRQPKSSWVHSGFWEILGYDAAEMAHTTACWQGLIDRDDLTNLNKSIKQNVADPTHPIDYVARYRRKDGSTIQIRCRGFVLNDQSGKPRYMIGAHTDLTRQQQAQTELVKRYQQSEKARKQLEQLALYDSLTGLGNRNLFVSQIEHMVKLTERRNEEVALMIMDLDGFKNVNDRLGHAGGDEVLKEFAVRLNRALRKADQKYRIGGDEFAVLLEPRYGAYDNAVQVADKLAGHMADAMEIRDHSCKVGVSIGIAVFPDHGREPEELIRKADAAMYEAKKKNVLVAGASLDHGATTVLAKLRL